MVEQKKRSEQINEKVLSTKFNNELEEQEYNTYLNDENSHSELTSPVINNKFQNNIQYVTLDNRDKSLSNSKAAFDHIIQIDQ